jgi:hypothetical protein
MGRIGAALLAYWTCVTSLQWAGGAFRAAFGGYPDEPSHYLSGLMVYDWLHAGGSPLRYAADYYAHLPYFAIGYWPPLFYLAESAWMTLFGTGRAGLLVMVGMIGALWSTTIFCLVSERIGPWRAWGLGLAFLLLPAVEWSNRLVMTDTFYGLLCLWAVLALDRFLASGRWEWSLAFGLLTGMALLAKTNSVWLFGVMLVAQRWDRLPSWKFWVGPAAALALWIPWLWIARGTLGIGLEGAVRPGWSEAGWDTVWGIVCNLSCLLVPAALGYTALRRERPALAVAPLCFLAMLLAARVPVLPRYLIPGLGLAVAAAGFGWRKWTWAALAGFAAVSLTQYEWPAGNDTAALIEFVCNRGTGAVLVPTDQEGGFIAEFAMRDQRRPERYLLRPRKLLVETNWHSGKYRLRYATTGELEALFNRMPVQYVIVASEAKEPHEDLLARTMRENPQRWIRIYAGKWEVYEDQARPTVPPAAVRAELEQVMGNRINPNGPGT